MYLVKLKDFRGHNPSYWRDAEGRVLQAIVTERDLERDYPNRLYWPDTGEFSNYWWADWQLEFIGVLT